MEALSRDPERPGDPWDPVRAPGCIAGYVCRDPRNVHSRLLLGRRVLVGRRVEARATRWWQFAGETRDATPWIPFQPDRDGIPAGAARVPKRNDGRRGRRADAVAVPLACPACRFFCVSEASQTQSKTLFSAAPVSRFEMCMCQRERGLATRGYGLAALEVGGRAGRMELQTLSHSGYCTLPFAKTCLAYGPGVSCRVVSRAGQRSSNAHSY